MRTDFFVDVIDAPVDLRPVEADAAETAALMDPRTPAGVFAWIYGERATQRAPANDNAGLAARV